VWHVPPPGPSLSKNGLLTAVIVLGAISSLGSMLVGPSESSYWGLVQLPGIANAVIWFTVIYTMWKSIRGSFTQTTPGDAVVGFFIPGYNIYWLFGAHLGFVRNYNRVASILQDRLGRGPTRIQTWPFLAFCVAFLAWGIATVGHTGNVVTGVAEMVQYGFRALVLVKICDAVNALHDIRRDSPEVSQA